MPKTKTPARKDGIGELTIPGRNGGRLKRGNPGNKGGHGRKPDLVRKEIRELLDNRVISEISRRLGPRNIKKIPDDILVKYLRELALFGLGTKHEHTGPDDGPLSHGVLLIPVVKNNGNGDSGEIEGGVKLIENPDGEEPSS